MRSLFKINLNKNLLAQVLLSLFPLIFLLIKNKFIATFLFGITITVATLFLSLFTFYSKNRFTPSELQILRFMIFVFVTIFISGIIYALSYLSPFLFYLFYTLTLVGYIPIFILLFRQIYLEKKFISANTIFPSVGLFFILFLLYSALINFYRNDILQKMGSFYYYYSYAKAILNIFLISILLFLTLTYMLHVKKVLWRFGLIGSFFLFLSDFFFTLENISVIKNHSYGLMFFCYVIVTMVTGFVLKGTEEEKTLINIENEKNELKVLYNEMEKIAHFLIILNKFFRHDLNNDLVVINSALELYKETGNEEFLNMIERRVEEIGTRINQQISTKDILSNIEIQKIPITFVSDVSLLFSNVTVKINNPDIYVKGNRLLNLILYNLISNAFIHGKTVSKVEIYCSQEKECAKIEIIDDGVGMTNEQKEKVMKSEILLGKTSGIGFGLALRTVRSLGGNILLSDNKPKGLKLTILLPIWNENEQSCNN